VQAEEVIQGSQEWKLARCGSLGASRVADAVAKIKSGWGASRANLMAELVSERLTGVPYESYASPAMQRGTEKEPDARVAYCFRTDNDVTEVGLVRHPEIVGTHASPDGLVGSDGLLEIKCPQSATHIETLLGKPIDGRYITQCQWQMACTGRAWVDFCSFDDRLPEEMRVFVQRVTRDQEAIDYLEKEVKAFIYELDVKVDNLKRLYGQKAAA